MSCKTITENHIDNAVHALNTIFGKAGLSLDHDQLSDLNDYVVFYLNEHCDVDVVEPSKTVKDSPPENQLETLNIKFSVNGSVHQSITLIDPSYTADSIIQGLWNRTLYTTLSCTPDEPQTINLVEDHAPVAYIANQSNRCDYNLFQVDS